MNPLEIPPSRPLLQRLLERKFLVAVLLSAAGVFAVASRALPLNLETIVWILAPVLVWIIGETALDRGRITIPDVPGPFDDLARVLQAVALNLPKPPPGPTPEQQQELHQLKVDAAKLRLDEQREYLNTVKNGGGFPYGPPIRPVAGVGPGRAATVDDDDPLGVV